jgi:DNA-binding NarL/FixJ family response regulator
MNGYFIIFTDTKATNVLKEYEKHKPVIIILDHNLEGEKNGIEAYNDILNNFPHTSILVISARVLSNKPFIMKRFSKIKE